MADLSGQTNLGIDGWRDELQPYFQKSLVAKPIADTTISQDLEQGDTVHYPYVDSSSINVTSYTPGSTITVSGASGKTEALSADQKKVASTYIDDVRALQRNFGFRNEMSKRMTYKVKDTIDQHAFTQYSALTASTSTRLDDGILTGSSHNTSPITAIQGSTTSNSAGVINIFSKVRTYLRNNKQSEGDMFAAVTNEMAELIERTAINKGFNLADSTLKNGYMGNWQGFDIYRSQNLYNESSTGNSFTTGDFLTFGKKGGLDLAIQQSPVPELKEVSDQLGANLHIWSVYGSKLFTDKKDMLVVAPVGTYA